MVLEPELPLCTACRERAWSAQGDQSYCVGASPEAIAIGVRALGGLAALREPVPADSVIAILTVSGVVGGAARIAEAELSGATLVEVAEVLSQAMRGNSRASWMINYWKREFGLPLTTDPKWDKPYQW